MQYSIGVEYALHCLTYFVHVPKNRSIGINEIAEYQGVSETYLSKIFTKLKKAGIVSSTPGVKGGYALARKPEFITFWDVVEAIEGSSPLFQCTEIRRKTAILPGLDLSESAWHSPCSIHAIMLEAESKMRDFLKSKTLAELTESLQKKLPLEQQEATRQWFRNALEKK